MKKYKNKILANDFTKNVVTLITGTALAQAIPIALTPILARIYTPQDFGLFALFVAILTILGSISNARYELAIMLPVKETDAVHIMALAFLINVTFSLILLFSVILFHDSLVNLIGNVSIGTWLYFIPFAVFLTGLLNTFTYYLNRKSKYKELAKVNVIRSTLNATTQLAIGYIKTGAVGLISGQLFSLLLANIQIYFIAKSASLLNVKLTKLKLFAMARKYKNFPKFTLWAGLANTSSSQFFSIFTSSLFGLTSLGYYSIVQRLLGAPSGFIGAAIGQVYFQEAAEEKQRTGTLVKSFNSTLKKLIIIGCPLFIFLHFYVEELFILFLGKSWAVAGLYAKETIPLFFVTFIVSPLTFSNQINLKNKLDMVWQFGLLGLYIAIFYFSKQYNIQFIDMLKYMVWIISAYYLFLLFLIYKHIKNAH